MASPNGNNTIFLSEQESERIRTLVKNRSKQCQEQKGNPRKPREKTAALQQATGASLMADMGAAPDPDLTLTGTHGDTVPVLAIGQPYPPCSLSLQQLTTTHLASLQMETHHRGQKLVLRRVAPVVNLVARSWTMVQDEKGEETERLEMCLHKSRYGEDILESAKLLVIKEPYFTLTDQGEATIRIDHPSDLVVMHDEGEERTHADQAAAEKAVLLCKNQGNAALKQQDLPLAHAKYTAGLKMARRENVAASNSALAQDISRNRAHVNLLLGRLDDVIADANDALIGKDDEKSKDLDSKACYRAGCAAYHLGRFTEAKQFFQKQQKLTPEDKDARIYLKKIVLRMREQETGQFDLLKLRAALSRARPRVDAASFLKNTAVGPSQGRGRGLFVTQNIPAGEVIMCEKALCVAWGHQDEALTAMTYDIRDDRIRASPVGLTRVVVEKLLHNSSHIASVTELCGDYEGDGKNVMKNADGPVVDVFRVHDSISRNAFGLGSQFGEEGARDATTGLWIHAAYTNHSCLPNAKKEIIGDLIILRATQLIQTGEEIFHSYDETRDFGARQAALMTTWGFECHCRLCEAERADGQPVRDKRMSLMAESAAFVERTPWAGANRLAIRKAQRLAKQIDETYDENRYRDLPRHHGQDICMWLSKASPRWREK